VNKMGIGMELYGPSDASHPSRRMGPEKKLTHEEFDRRYKRNLELLAGVIQAEREFYLGVKPEEEAA
jgi:hypothetical protein